MTFFDSITFAAQRADSFDVPPGLLPLCISDRAAVLCGLDSDRLGGADWD